jgi:hypothetical protein
MSSVQSVIAQPKTRKFVGTQDSSSGSERGPYMFPQAHIDAWYADNSSDVTKVSNGMYIVNEAGNYESVVSGLSPQGHIDGRKTFVDMGKTIYIGNNVSSDLLVLQLVQVFGLSVSGGHGARVGYIIVENNADDLGSGDDGRFMVRVARI